MAKYDAHKIVEQVVSSAMQAQDAFVKNLQTLSERGADIDDVTDNRNARTGIAIWAELKGIRTALTEIAQILADKEKSAA